MSNNLASLINYRPTEKQIKIITLCFFIIILIIGLSSYKDYGVSVDEPFQREHGIESVKYVVREVLPKILSGEILKGIPPFPEGAKRVGIIFQVPMLFVEYVLRYDQNTRALWELRHLYNFIWFYIGLIFFYKTILIRHNWFYALLGCLLMFLSPRIFAHSFYNIKDLAFLSIVMVVFYYSFRYLERKDYRNAFLLAIAISIASNVRIIGLAFFVIVVAFTFIDWIKSSGPINKKEFISLALLFLAPLLTVLLWPGLWSRANPITYLLNVAVVNLNFIFWDGTTIYLGELVRGQDLPWHYILVWFGVTTPVSFLLFFLIGVFLMFSVLFNLGHQLFSNQEQKENLFCLLSFFCPIIFVIIWESTLYSGWRHLFFIYVPFMIITIWGISHIAKYTKVLINLNSKAKYLCLILLVFLITNVFYLSYWMIVNHPYQYVYFNFLAGNQIDVTFDRDYWRLSARAGLDYIVINDKRNNIKVVAKYLDRNIAMLDPEDQKRITPLEWSNKDEADYVIENYRNIQGSYWQEKEIHSVVVDGFTIMSVLDLSIEPSQFETYNQIIKTEDFTGAGISRDSAWSYNKKGGFWSVGEQAQLRIHLGPQNKNLIFDFSLGAYNPPESPDLLIQVYVNNIYKDNWFFSNQSSFPQTQFILKPDELSEDGFVNIDFKIIDPKSPYELGLGFDIRQLGIWLKSLEIRHD